MSEQDISVEAVKQIGILVTLVIISIVPLIFINTVGISTAILGLAFGTIGGLFLLGEMTNIESIN